MKILYDKINVLWHEGLDDDQAQPINVVPGNAFVVLEQRQSYTQELVEIFIERSAVEKLIEALRRAT